MRIIRLLLVAVTLLLLPLNAVAGSATGPVKLLYVTSAGWFHDYQAQTRLIADAASRYTDVSFDVVVGDIERLKQADFALGYDVLVYNFCHASRRDPQLVDNLIAATRDLAIPVLALHCTMHSFQHVPSWPAFLGLHTLRHETQRALTIKRVAQHAAVAGLPAQFELASDELYLNISVSADSIPLLSAYGVESGRDHVQAWLRPVGETELIGITLGHSEETLGDANFQRFIANAVVYLSGRQVTDEHCEPDCDAMVEILTQNVRYPTPSQRQCVIKAMFGIGGERVSQCTDLCKAEGNMPAAECEPGCQISNPWPNPESLWPSCL